MQEHRKRYKITHMVLTRLGQLGISVRDVLRQAGLGRGLLNDGRAALDMGQYFSFWRAISTVTGDPAIGFQIGSMSDQAQMRATIQKYLLLSKAITNLADDPLLNVQMDSILQPQGPELLMLAILVSRTYRDGLQRLARYKRLIHAAEQLQLIDTDDVVKVRFIWAQKGQFEVPETLVQTELATILYLGYVGIGRKINPVAVHLQRKRKGLSRFSDYEAFLGCPIKTGTGFNEIHFSAKSLDQAFQTYNVEVLDLLQPQLQTRLTEIEAQERITARVKEVLIELMSAKRPTVEDVAQELAVSKRTLQRKLRHEGTSFGEVLAKTRKELALFYLKNSKVEVAEVSFLLGFEDVTSFYRAFHSWTGETPTDYRMGA